MRSIYTFAFLLLAVGAFAQRTDTTEGRLYFSSSIALGIPEGPSSPNFSNGYKTTTGLKLRLSPHLFLAGDLSFDAYSYKKSSATYNLDGTANITSLALFFKYVFANGRLQPFLKAGGGGARLSVPVVTVQNAFATIENNAKLVSLAAAEAGLQYRLGPRYTFFISANHEWLGKSALLGNQAFRSTGIKLGLITPL